MGAHDAEGGWIMTPSCVQRGDSLRGCQADGSSPAGSCADASSRWRPVDSCAQSSANSNPWFFATGRVTFAIPEATIWPSSCTRTCSGGPVKPGPETQPRAMHPFCRPSKLESSTAEAAAQKKTTKLTRLRDILQLFTRWLVASGHSQIPG